MAVTWEELQVRCLQKLFSIDGDVLVVDSNTQPYIKSMPGAANEAMQILVTAGRAFKKCTVLEQTEDAEAETDEKIQGAATEDVQEGTGGENAGEETESIHQERRGGWIAYNLKGIAGDFYALDEIRLDDGETYEAFTGYRMEGDHILLLPSAKKGRFRVWYEAYPPKITKETPADLVLDLHPEELNMIALYMAGQLYKDDDVSIAQIYMNEWLTWLEELKESAKRAKSRNRKGGSWSSIKGWF